MALHRCQRTKLRGTDNPTTTEQRGTDNPATTALRDLTTTDYKTDKNEEAPKLQTRKRRRQTRDKYYESTETCTTCARPTEDNYESSTRLRPKQTALTLDQTRLPYSRTTVLASGYHRTQTALPVVASTYRRVVVEPVLPTRFLQAHQLQP